MMTPRKEGLVVTISKVHSLNPIVSGTERLYFDDIEKGRQYVEETKPYVVSVEKVFVVQ